MELIGLQEFAKLNNILNVLISVHEAAIAQSTSINIGIKLSF
ncbi:9810_t:CDS:2 [Cetraspora pellucida]|uniref:9810_t:CDS:1 n=1 Tax=Cetraspora pellucida TaxID=1433469 RepID=A0A9N9DPV3_9GLOM|nr:9810_t:CDS:2 [Cetraspora pellucida]